MGKRSVKKMLIYDSSAVHDNETGVDEENLYEMTYMLAAFGKADAKLPGLLPNLPGAPNAGLPKDFMTVFEPSQFAKIWQQVVEKHAAREPVVIRENLTVVDNAHWGIKGGWQVEVIWAIELPVAAFRASLPAETAAALPSFFPNWLA